MTYSNQVQGLLSTTAAAVKAVVFISLSSPSELPTPPGVSVGPGDLQQRSGDGWMDVQ